MEISLSTKLSNPLPIIDALRMTLATIENDPEFSPDDPAIKNLKLIIVRRIAEIEQRRGLTVVPKSMASIL